MTPEQFCYWLQGFYEITGEVEGHSAEQVRVIKAHLGLVFQHVLDREHDKGDPQKAQQLDNIHRPDRQGPVKYRC